MLESPRSILARARAAAGPAIISTRRRLAALGVNSRPLRRLLAGKRTRAVLRNGALAALATALLLGLAFFAFRNAILRGALVGRIRAFERREAGATVRFAAARFRGQAGIEIEGLRLRAAARGLDVGVGRFSARLSLRGMLLGRVRFKSLALSDLNVNLGRALPAAAVLPGGPVPMPGPDARPRRPPPPAETVDHGARVAGLLDLYFNRVPDRLVIERLFIHTAFAGVRQALYVPRLAIGGPAFAAAIEVFEEGKKWSCSLSGGVDRGARRLELRLDPAGEPGTGHRPLLPFLGRQWGLQASFDSLAIGLRSRGRRGGVLRLEGSLAVKNLALGHPRIAAETVLVAGAALDFALRVGPDFVELAEPSRVSFNRLSFRPRVTLVLRPARRVLVKVPETRFAADELFASLPDGLFSSLAGIRTSGELAFRLDFAIDLSRPEDLELDVDLSQSGFRIRRFGRVDFRAVNEPFLYTAYESDRPLRSFVVGPENPDFIPLGDIPDFLKHSVLISEDGAFFSHRGFLLGPFKDSIVANLRAGRFVRGASTISMQLVKNLYLRRHKTVARKLEEMLITWLIEENRLVPKERMLEIYLNIIEWGPGVYGAREAARFYFAKEAGELTLAEAVFLAAIVPRPRRFTQYFGDDQRLRPWLQAYYADVAAKMLSRGWITQADADTLRPEVELTGPARGLLKEAPAEEAAPGQGLPEEAAGNRG